MDSPRTPSTASSFEPRRWLRTGHLQTLAGNFLKRPSGLPEPEERLFQVEDDVQVLCHCHWQPEAVRHTTMTLMLVHGLEGSSSSGYVLGTGSKAWARGWNVVRMNIRNCGGTENLTPTLYHSGLSGDIRAVISTLIEQDALQRVGVAGFSMGGNQVLKCIGEWGTDAPKQLISAAGISPAADLSLSADAIHRPSNRMYEWWFMRGLRARLRRKAALFPGKYDVRLLAKANSIRDFDEHITARYMGFEGAEDYYAKASSAQVLDRLAIPTLVIHAADDPFIKLSPSTIAKLEANPHIHFIYTKHGGHCAFLADANGYDGRWAENQIIDFLDARLKQENR